MGEDDRAAIERLLREYDRPTERSRVPLLDAMEEHGGIDEAHRLAGSEDPGERRTGARLMLLLPDGSHLPWLDRLVRDPDDAVAGTARRALAEQVRTPAWRATVERLAADADPELRTQAARWLSGR
jgi:hypothetical protein